MFVCVECGHLFTEPKHCVETHGFRYGPFEEWSGCPLCGGNYVDAHQCDGCGEYIVDNYIKVEHQRYCQDCYETYELGDED